MANGRLLQPGILDDLALGQPADALAIALALDQPWADCVLSGAATDGQLRSNVRAADLVLDDVTRSRSAALAEDSAAYWATRSGLAWA